MAKFLIATLVVVAMYALAMSFYMTAKAHLAQALMTYSWQKGAIQGQNKSTSPPWPWADFYPIAKLNFVRLNSALLVLNTDSGQALAFGPGLTAASAINQNQMTIISGHNDTHFKVLKAIKIGDELQLETQQAAIQYYKIDKLQIIDLRAGELRIHIQHERDQGLILVTCYPFGELINQTPYRLIVHARQSVQDKGT